MVLTTITGPEDLLATAAPAWAPLPLKVQLNTSREPLPATSMAPPAPLVPVVLPEKVLLLTVAVPEAKIAPPSLVAVLRSKVQFATVRVPLLLMAAPSPPL